MRTLGTMVAIRKRYGVLLAPQSALAWHEARVAIARCALADGGMERVLWAERNLATLCRPVVVEGVRPHG
jgi:hypothetical protein